MSITVIKCGDKTDAAHKAFEFLKKMIEENTLLLLSGGTSPNELYRLIAEDGHLHPGAVAMVDERFGEKMHNNSNEKMIKEAGLVEFYQILEEGIDPEQTAIDYEKTVKELFAKYPKKVAVMGIGTDGHTAGIKPDLEYDHSRWVVAYNDEGGYFGQRITTTFECLEQIDEFVLLVFGEEKKSALQKMLEDGFFKKAGIPATVFTDIEI